MKSADFSELLAKVSELLPQGLKTHLVDGVEHVTSLPEGSSTDCLMLGGSKYLGLTHEPWLELEAAALTKSGKFPYVVHEFNDGTITRKLPLRILLPMVSESLLSHIMLCSKGTKEQSPEGGMVQRAIAALLLGAYTRRSYRCAALAIITTYTGGFGG